MRFYLNRQKHYSSLLGYDSNPHYKESSDGYGSDWSDDRRNQGEVYMHNDTRDTPSTLESDFAEGEVAANEPPETPKSEIVEEEAVTDDPSTTTEVGAAEEEVEVHDPPIKRLPEEILQHIFEVNMEEFQRSNDAVRPIIVGDEEELVLPRSETESRYINGRLRYLQEVGLVCKDWLSATGPLTFRDVLVDGVPSDYGRANAIFGSPFPGTNWKPRGCYVRRLVVDMQFVFKTKHFVRQVIKLLRLCSNLRELVFLSDLRLPSYVIQQIWDGGVAGTCEHQSLSKIHWIVRRDDHRKGKSTNIVRHLQGLFSLSELVLTEQDKFYTFPNYKQIELKQLRTLKIKALRSSIMKHIALWKLPSIKDCHLWVGDEKKDVNIRALRRFFSEHGASLVHLELLWLPKCYHLLTMILAAAPNLEELALHLKLLVFKAGALKHENVQLLKITGTRVLDFENLNTSVGTYLAQFLRTVMPVENSAFPRLSTVELRDIGSHGIGKNMDDAAIKDWDKWFKESLRTRQVILDTNLIPLQKTDVFDINVDRRFIN